MTQSFLKTGAAMLCVAAFSLPAAAAPKVKATEKSYRVTATTIDGLKREMKAKGPRGFWAYTAWYVKWSGSCQLSVTTEITMPKHAKPSAMPADVRRKFDAMVVALRAHEQKHANNGIAAAREIEKAGCKNGNAIIAKYNKADIQLDKKTGHGSKEGVVLK